MTRLANQVIRGETDRERLKRLIESIPVLSRVDVKGPQRSIPQNDIIHAMCTDIARQLVWHGRKWPMQDWKRNLLGCFKTEVRTMPRADGFGVIPVGGTSDLSRDEASAFIDYIAAFAAQYGVSLNDHTEKAA